MNTLLCSKPQANLKNLEHHQYDTLLSIIDQIHQNLILFFSFVFSSYTFSLGSPLQSPALSHTSAFIPACPDPLSKTSSYQKPSCSLKFSSFLSLLSWQNRLLPLPIHATMINLLIYFENNSMSANFFTKLTSYLQVISHRTSLNKFQKV